MIHLIDVTKAYPGPDGWRTVLAPVRMTIPSHRRVGVLGLNGAGKSTLLRLIAGVEEPDEGTIVRKCSVSWPLGFGGGVHADLTGEENAAFIARIYARYIDEVIAFVYDFSELGTFMRMPVRTYSTGMRGRLAFALSMAVEFDCYLVDELTGVGDKNFKAKCKEAFMARAERSGLLFVSHNEATVREYCEMALVINDGLVYAFEDIDEATDFYKRMADRGARAKGTARVHG